MQRLIIALLFWNLGTLGQVSQIKNKTFCFFLLFKKKICLCISHQTKSYEVSGDFKLKNWWPIWIKMLGGPSLKKIKRPLSSSLWKTLTIDFILLGLTSQLAENDNKHCGSLSILVFHISKIWNCGLHNNTWTQFHRAAKRPILCLLRDFHFIALITVSTVRHANLAVLTAWK